MQELLDTKAMIGIKVELEKIILEENGVYERIIAITYIDIALEKTSN